MKTLLSLLAVVGILNIALFAFLKLLNLVEPFLYRIFVKRELIDAIKNDPEFQERSKVRVKYTHWFWSLTIVLFFAIGPLTGINYFLAFFTALMLYFVGTSESSALASISAKYRLKQYVDAEEVTIKFFEELANKIEALHLEPKDDERN